MKLARHLSIALVAWWVAYLGAEIGWIPSFIQWPFYIVLAIPWQIVFLSFGATYPLLNLNESTQLIICWITQSITLATIIHVNYLLFLKGLVPKSEKPKP